MIAPGQPGLTSLAGGSFALDALNWTNDVTILMLDLPLS